MREELYTELIVAIKNNNLKALEELLNEGKEAGYDFDINYKNGWSGYTLLHHAIECGTVEAMDKLLAVEGIDVNAGSVLSGKTPLHYAVFSNEDIKKLERLLAVEGLDVNKKDLGGEAPLHRANRRMIDKLLEAEGIDVNTRNKYGETRMDTVFSYGESKLKNSLKDKGGRETYALERCLYRLGHRIWNNKGAIIGGVALILAATAAFIYVKPEAAKIIISDKIVDGMLSGMEKITELVR